MDISQLRREYTYAGLRRADLDPDPFAQFARWFQQAGDAGLDSPNAFSLATVSPDGAPSLRTVLLKTFDRDGFVFYTNYSSRKAQDIGGNPQVAALFHWLDLDRQVKVLGRAEKVSAAESLAYFASRPRGSQIGAWCSHQSRVVSSRSLLEAQFEHMRERFRDHEIPLPDFWGGFRIVPSSIEFWQGRANRLHDRLQYTRRSGAPGDWSIERLAP